MLGAAAASWRLNVGVGVLLHTRPQDLPHLQTPLLRSMSADQVRTAVGLVVEEWRRRQAGQPS